MMIIKLEIVGSVDTGIEAMAWSPDQDLVVLVTGKSNTRWMSCDAHCYYYRSQKCIRNDSGF